MPRADFYLIAKPRFLEKPLLLVCELAKLAYQKAQQPTLILARDLAQAEELDDLLWSFEPDEFLPHQIAGTDEDEDDTPILISAPEVDTPSRPLVINLRDDVWLKPCERILEVVPADPAAREPLRERWKQYQALGFEMNKHDM
ncbi:MAG: DNA polymerase III subunit chi [Pseudoxanthomonas sp.]